MGALFNLMVGTGRLLYSRFSLFLRMAEIDLHRVIRKGNILKDIHNRYILHQILKAIVYIHSANVIHRDLKVGISKFNTVAIVSICQYFQSNFYSELISYIHT